MSSTEDSGDGTLREALLAATSGATITFDPAVFPPTSPATINVTGAPLPDLDNGGVTVDASGAGVVLNGSALRSGEHGLSITSSGNKIAGLCVVGFVGAGVNMSGPGATRNTLQDNRIGLGPGFVRQAFPADLAISPAYATDCTLYAATVTSGIHKSTDCGATWEEANNGLTGLRLAQVEFPPHAPDGLTAYALTENGDLFSTSNGGAEWNLVNSTLGEVDRRNLVLSAGFATDRTMYSAARGWSSDSFGGQPGVFESTDGGVTWTRVSGSLHDLHVRRLVATSDVAAARVLFALTDSGIERTTDGGATWTVIASPGGGTLLDLALSPAYSADQTVYLAVQGGLVYRSSDGGGSWTASQALRADPRYLALSPSFLTDRTICHGGDFNDTAYCSSDGGATWAATPTGLASGYNDLGTGLLFSPGYAVDRTIFAAATSGLARSADGGSSWEWLDGFRLQGNGVGVLIQGGAQDNTVGPANVIGNNSSGVAISGNSAYNRLGGNLIGTDPAGLVAQANVGSGINLDAAHNIIGGALGRNVISGNLRHGLSISGGGVANIVAGNSIGVDASGYAVLANGGQGVVLSGGASANVIGGPMGADRNTISGNHWGISINDPETRDNRIEGNFIGLDADGTTDLGNTPGGIALGGRANRLTGNVISGNHDWGVFISGGAASENVVSGNLIGTNARGDAAVPNQDGGIIICGGASGNLVGGETAADSNIISGNRNEGIRIVGEGTAANTVAGNTIGLDAVGAVALGQNIGVNLCDGAEWNIIGGTTPAAGNIIAGNAKAGVRLCSGAHDNTLSGNVIGPDAAGAAGVGNGAGVALDSGAALNTIGPGNHVAFNRAGGVTLRGESTLSNTVTANAIHSNAGHGIELLEQANDAIQPPTVPHIDLAAGIAEGQACPGCTVELFSDAGDEGRWYEGSALTDANGAFTFAGSKAFTGRYVTATATDGRNNTSAFAAPAGSESWTILVTNASDAVNGEVTSVAALLDDPGPDGVSFREAAFACNNTLGPKTILFAPSLKGSTIRYASAGIANARAILLTSGQLTIDGDVDGDGQADITLDGSLAPLPSEASVGLFVWSSENEVRHLSFSQFSNAAIYIYCLCPPESLAGIPRHIHGNRFLGNVMRSTQAGESTAIIIGPNLPDAVIDDTLIAGNRISGSYGIAIKAGACGAPGNRITNVIVADNVLLGTQGYALDIGAADMASDFPGAPEPTTFADHNLIEHLTITGNLIEDVQSGIHVYAANQGNRYNQVRDVHIIGNTLRRVTHLGMYLMAGGNGGRERTTSFNVMEDVEISGNTLNEVKFGIWIKTGDGGETSYPFGVGISDNRITGLLISDNTIETYSNEGITLWGGFASSKGLLSSRNVLERVTLSGNRILSPERYADTSGLTLVGGADDGGRAEGNIIREVTIEGNTVQSNVVGISLVGGQGPNATGNRVTIQAMDGNDLVGSSEPLRVTDNRQGATDNRVEVFVERVRRIRKKLKGGAPGT